MKDIRPGNQGSNARTLTNVNGILYFFADDGVVGDALWKSDGTDMGTVLVKDINLTDASPLGFQIVSFNGRAYFGADDGTNGTELWVSDGTTAGTVMLKDIRPGSVSSEPSYFVITMLYVLFVADDGANGKELWRTDGTTGGTVMVSNLNPSGGSIPRNLTNIKPGMIVFGATDGVNGVELYKSNGTPEGTSLVQNIAAGSGNSEPQGFAVLGSNVIFAANDSTNGFEPWLLPIPNTAPVANNSGVMPSPPAGITATATGSDADPDQIVFSLASNPANGTVQMSPSGVYTYTPNILFLGSDSFTFRVSDGIDTSNTATVSISVAANRLFIIPIAPVQTPIQFQ